MMTFPQFSDRLPMVLATLVALGLGLLWPGASLGAAEERPRVVAERLDAALLEAMRNAETLGYQGRYELLAPVLQQTFDFPFMARVSIGRYWAKMDGAQRAKRVEAFARLSIATFAARFDGYGGETFQILGEEVQPRGVILVVNHLIKGDGEAVPLNYLMREDKGRWRIVDVFLDAKYSELAIKRSEYTSVYKRDGFARLIEIMEAKITAFAGDGAG
jgi:phospholipid transport system substrate-binding protein